MPEERSLRSIFSLPVLVVALGYMVDMYDLFLFTMVRVPSLVDLGVGSDDMLHTGIYLLNLQMGGLLIGGIVWGILADKRGRLTVLFGSILIYSLANIANAFVTTVDQYAILRLIAGFGLAGELGAGITLVAEILPRKIRGYGTTLVALMGLPGSIAAYFVVTIFDWRTSYIVGGVLGLLLLIMRVSVRESAVFASVKDRSIRRGDVRMFLENGKRAMKYVFSILIGFPIWFVVGILITFSPELAKALNIVEPVSAGKAVMLAFTGQLAGNLIAGVLSQYLQSRKKVVALFILSSLVFMLVYLLVPLHSADMFYTVCLLLGLCNGYWALFITVAAELFGTNLRATVATTVPNFVRGAVIPLTWTFRSLIASLGMINSALVTGLIAFALALIALRYLEETFSKDLDYVEE
jgi:MFS family permease